MVSQRLYVEYPDTKHVDLFHRLSLSKCFRLEMD